MKRAAIYTRVSTVSQSVVSQSLDLRQLAKQRGYEIVHEYTDTISGAKSKRPGLDQLTVDAHRHRFDVVMIWSFDRLARSVRHFLSVLDDLSQLEIEVVSFRENFDTSGTLGRALVVVCALVGEIEKSLTVERVRMGMRRAKLEGKRIGRAPLQVNRAVLLADRKRGMSLTQLAKAHAISKASVCRVLKLAKEGVSGGFRSTAYVAAENKAVTVYSIGA